MIGSRFQDKLVFDEAFSHGGQSTPRCSSGVPAHVLLIWASQKNWGGRHCGLSVLCLWVWGKSFVPFPHPPMFVCIKVVNEGFSLSWLVAQKPCTAKVHVCMHQIHPCHYVLIPLWSDSGEGQIGTGSSCKGKRREEAVGDFVWKIKLSPSEAIGAVSWPRRGEVAPRAPCDAGTHFFLKDILSVIQRCPSLWASVEMSNKLQWFVINEQLQTR